MFRSKQPKVDISIPRKALEAIFDECDQYEVEETGGRLIGMYKKKGHDYEIDVFGVIGPGPNARRSATSFFQDGEYQERVFRAAEKTHANLEHLGNWHTHHCNGLETLSGGDRETYRTTVNHHNHNTDFFYALLVTQKTPHRAQRYEVKHFLLFRGDETIHEIEKSRIHLVDGPQSGVVGAVFSSMAPPGGKVRTRGQ